MREVWPLIKGTLTWVPWLYRPGESARGGSISPDYCYSVWLRHLVTLHKLGMRVQPSSVAELGPGLSLGVGIAALLSGSRRYVALDVARDATRAGDRALLPDIAALFAARANLPDDMRFPEVLPRLSDYGFPDFAWHTADAADLAARRASVHLLLGTMDGAVAHAGGLTLQYVVPWDMLMQDVEPVDLVLAQAVMEHVGDPAEVYRALFRMLRPGGWLSFTIDFRSHGLTRAWNGHWGFGRRAWEAVQGRRRWGLNRWTLSQHLRALEAAGLRVALVQPESRPSALEPGDLAEPFRAMASADLTTAAAYVAAQR